MRAPIDATRIVTIIVSNMPDVPVPMELKAEATVREPVPMPTTPERMVPHPRTMNTLIPQREAIRTAKYGIACHML